MHNVRRKYRGAEFGVNISTSVSPTTFYEIEHLTKELGITKAEVVRLLILRGLADYCCDGKLPLETVSVHSHITQV